MRSRTGSRCWSGAARRKVQASTSLSYWPGARWARRCCSSTCMSTRAIHPVTCRIGRRRASCQSCSVRALGFVAGGVESGGWKWGLVGVRITIAVAQSQQSGGAALPHSCATLAAMQVRSAFYFWFFISVPGGWEENAQANTTFPYQPPTLQSPAAFVFLASRFFIPPTTFIPPGSDHNAPRHPTQRSLVPQRRKNQPDRRRTYQGHSRVASSRASDPLFPDPWNAGRDADHPDPQEHP